MTCLWLHSKWVSKEQYQGVLNSLTQLLGAFQQRKLAEPDKSETESPSDNMVT